MTNITDTTKSVDHYVWKAFYISNMYDEQTGAIFATTKERAMELVADDADIGNEGWTKNSQTDYPLYQITDSKHHIVTVMRERVYGEIDE